MDPGREKVEGRVFQEWEQCVPNPETAKRLVHSENSRKASVAGA